MLGAFLPVPLTFIIYNKLNVKKGFGFAYQYTLLIFVISMLSMFGVSFMESGVVKTILSVLCGLIASFSVGAMFAVSYSIPSKLASDDEKETGISHSAMYFAVQGLFAGIASGLGGATVLTILKDNVLFDRPATFYITLISAIACLVAFGLVFILPKSLKDLGKESR
jgi:MFS family permease